MPKVAFDGQRQKEEELIFRGQQYTRAIQLYVRRFGRYPTSLEELEDTNELRFIRKLYKDPMTTDGEWRLIHVGPGPVFIDALNPPVPVTPKGAAGGSSTQPSTNPFDTARGVGSNPQPVGQQPGEPEATRANGNSGFNPIIQPRAGATPQENSGSQTGTGSQAGIGSQNGSQVFGSGGAIAGVASKNEGDSIKVVNGYKHYNEWEFIYDYRADPRGLAAINKTSGVQQPQPGGGQNQPGGNQPGGNQPNRPSTTNPPQNPLGVGGGGSMGTPQR
jgi:hypothetical protein